MFEKINFKVQKSIHAIPREDWNRLAYRSYPFIRHEFLSALEDNNCVGANTGWSPQHVTIFDETHKLIAVVPTYLKTNSYGEYVFDWGWADAYHRHGLDYYPKLLSAIPFTPCVGPRISIDGDWLERNSEDDLIVFIESRIKDYCAQEKINSWHLLFPERGQALGSDLLIRKGVQYHWYNKSYLSFDDYLNAMTSRKRKSVKKERTKIVEHGIDFERIEGADISPEVLKQFYVYYQATYMKRGQRGYLSPAFFEELVQSMPENLLLIMARSQEKYVAAAMFFKGGDTLYGRYWGCLEEYDQLHFETCYYQGIEYCIENGLDHFDSGAQGEHKIQRGFEPIFTQSWHWIAHPQFRGAIDNFVKEEAEHLALYKKQAAERLPFKLEEN